MFGVIQTCKEQVVRRHVLNLELSYSMYDSTAEGGS